MAGNWRIRHKLILGMFLVLATMGLLLAGTLNGLSSYRATMRTLDSKLTELEKADDLKEAIKALAGPFSQPTRQVTILEERIGPARDRLAEYRAQLDRTVHSGRDPNRGYEEGRCLLDMEKMLDALGEELKKAQVTTQVSVGGSIDSTNLLAAGSKVREKIDQLIRAAEDLTDILNQDIRNRVIASKNETRLTVAVLITTSVVAVLLMAGILRFFYKGVVRPLRHLEHGVGGVARGDFDRRIEIHTGDEMEDLANAFNLMTGRLSEMYQSLAQQVNERSRQLVRSERLAGVGFLAAGVAHEINNPLASIAFCSEALDSRLAELMQGRPLSPQDREVIAKYLKMIQEEAFRCKEITQKLLAFSRGGERKREATDLAGIIQNVLDVVQHLQSSKGKRVVFEPRGPVSGWANAQEIKQVFLNLVVNALESMEEGGQLTISHADRGGMTELVFRDSGCGMSAEVLENIFEPFFTRSRTGKGTGLGLSISHRIITQHGGEIEANSAGPGQGSTFVIRLPVDPPADAETPEEDVRDPEEEFLKLSTARQQRKVA